MFERCLRRRVIVPALIVMVVLTVLAAYRNGVTGLVAALVVWQFTACVLLISVARGTHRARRTAQVVNRNVTHRVQAIERRLEDLGDTQATKFNALQAEMAAASRRAELSDELAVRHFEAVTKWQDGMRILLEDMRSTNVRRDDVQKLLAAESKNLTDVVSNNGRRQYGQVDAMIGLYYDLRPPRSLPPMAGWAASPDMLRYVHEMIRTEGKTSVIECGSGVTTLLMAYAMRETGSGRVVALDHLETYAEQTRRLLQEHNLEEWAEVRFAPLTDVKIDDQTWTWYDPAQIPDGQFDLIVVDGPPGSTGEHARYPAIPLLRDQFADTATVVLDDHDREQERAVGRMWQELLPDWTKIRHQHYKGTLTLRREK